MKERLDVLLVKRNLAESREKAKAIIMAGNVFVDGQREDKAGNNASPEEVSIEVRGHTAAVCKPRRTRSWKKRLQHFDVNGRGESMYGCGFFHRADLQTVCLQNGAVKVFAIDVGQRTTGLEITAG